MVHRKVYKFLLVCQLFNGINYCGKIYEPIHRKNLVCKGNENSINNCLYDIQTETCSHD